MKKTFSSRFWRQFFQIKPRQALTAADLAQVMIVSFRLLPLTLIAQCAGMCTVMGLFWSSNVPRWFLWTWFISGLCVLYLVAHGVRRFYIDKHRVQRIRRWLSRWNAVIAILGIVWAVGGVVLMHMSSGLIQGLTMGLMVTVLFASWPALSCWMPSLVIYTISSMLPVAASLGIEYGVSNVMTMLATVVITGFILYAGQKLNDLIVLSIQAQGQHQRLVQKLHSAVTQAERARQSAETDSLRRARFFAAANHDIRQPLQALAIYLSLLAKKAPPQLKGVVADMQTTSEHISGLVEEVLMVTRMEFGQLRVHPQSFYVRDFLEDLVASCAPIAQDKGLVLRVVCSPSVSLYTDPHLLMRACKNLVSNAIKYARCDAHPREIVLRYWVNRDREGTLSIIDCGPGIAPEERTRLFETFWRGRAGSDVPGFGLGLSIVKGIAKELGASLSVGSKVGRGSIFRLHFSEVESDQAQWAGLAVSQAASSYEPLRGHVLLLEDHDTVRLSLSALLESWGLEVVSVSDEATLSDWLKSKTPIGEEDTGAPLDLMLTDFNLGPQEPNGLKLADRVKTIYPEAKVIVMSAVAQDQIEEEVRLGHYAWTSLRLQKPVQPELLYTMIKEALLARVSEIDVASD